MVKFEPDTPLNTGVNFLRNVAITGTYALLVGNFSKKVAIPAGVALSAVAGALRMGNETRWTRNNTAWTDAAAAALHDAVIHTLEVGLLFGLARGINHWSGASALARVGTVGLGSLATLWATCRVAGLHGMPCRPKPMHTDSPVFGAVNFFDFEWQVDKSFNTGVNFLRNLAVTGTYALFVANFSKKIAIPAGIALSAIAGAGRAALDSESGSREWGGVALHDALFHTLEVGLLFGVARGISRWPNASALGRLGTVGLSTLTTLWATCRVAGLHGWKGQDGDNHPMLDTPIIGFGGLMWG